MGSTDKSLIMGAGGEGVGECFTLSGWLKIIQSFSVFTLIMLQRIGDNTKKVYFGASDMILDTQDPTYPAAADTEIIGNGALICLIIVTPMILLAYAVEGRKNVQATSLDAIFSFVGAAMLIAVGGMTCFAWNNANSNNANIGRYQYEVAGTIGVMSIITGLIYLADFFYTMYQHAYLTPNQDF